MKFLSYNFIILIFITASLQADCEDCKKIRDEIAKAWKMNLELTKEVRALTQDLLKHSDTIRRLHSN